jgi:hypothetical protein
MTVESNYCENPIQFDVFNGCGGVLTIRGSEHDVAGIAEAWLKLAREVGDNAGRVQ